MKAVTVLAPALLLVGCATRSAVHGPSRQWLTGTWLLIERPEDRDLGGCASGLPIRYRGDGTYALFEGEEGRWRLDGSRLTETATAAHDGVNPAEVAIGKAFVSRVERTGADEMVKFLANGGRLRFRRCPASR